MSRVRRFATLAFSANNGHELRASIADTVAICIATLAVWAAYVNVVNFVGHRWPTGTYEFFGFTHYYDAYTAMNVIWMLIFAAFTGFFSLVTTVIVQFHAFRPQPVKRSKLITAAAILAATVVTTTVGASIASHELSSASLTESFTTFGLVAVPAAIRLTSPTAFSYAPAYFAHSPERV